MAKTKVRRAGAYRVKSGETRASRVVSKSAGSSRPPSAQDKRLVKDVLREKRA